MAHVGYRRSGIGAGVEHQTDRDPAAGVGVGNRGKGLLIAQRATPVGIQVPPVNGAADAQAVQSAVRPDGQRGVHLTGHDVTDLEERHSVQGRSLIVCFPGRGEGSRVHFEGGPGEVAHPIDDKAIGGIEFQGNGGGQVNGISPTGTVGGGGHLLARSYVEEADGAAVDRVIVYPEDAVLPVGQEEVIGGDGGRQANVLRPISGNAAIDPGAVPTRLPVGFGRRRRRE